VNTDVSPITTCSDRLTLRSQFDGSVAAEPAVLVVREAPEGRVLVGDPPVHVRAEQVPAIRVGEDARQRTGRRQVGSEGDDALLDRVFVVAEEEQAVPADGSADPDSGIPAVEIRVSIKRIASQRGVGCHGVVPE